MTHFATADEPGDAFFGEQLARFAPWARAVRAAHPGIVVHAANSAATLRDPRGHFDLVRTGVALYGLDPFGEDPRAARPEPGAGAVVLGRGRQADRAGGERRVRQAVRRRAPDTPRDRADRLRRRRAAAR